MLLPLTGSWTKVSGFVSLLLEIARATLIHSADIKDQVLLWETEGKTHGKSERSMDSEAGKERLKAECDTLALF